MPISTNNFLSSTNFKLTLDAVKYPGLSCDIQTAVHPAVNIGVTEQASPYRQIPVPADKYNFDPLTITLLLTDDLASYITIFNWLKDCIETADDPLSAKTSDIRLTIFNNKNNLTKTITYVRAFPSDLGAINFATTDAGDEYITVDTTFHFAFFKID